MARLAVVFGLMLVVLVAGGCPRKIGNDGRGGAAPIRPASRPIDNRDGAVGQGEAQGETPAGDEVNGELETEAGLAGEGMDVTGEGATADESQEDEASDDPEDSGELEEASSSDEEEDVVDDKPLDEEPATDEVNEDSDAVDEEPVADEEAIRDEADNERIVEDEPIDEPSFTPQPPKVKLSREAARFAGSWQAVVYDFGGETEGAMGERFVELNDSGSFEATALNEAGRLETGIWDMDGTIITLSFGPAGDVEYSIDQPADNIAIWHGPNGGAMFCIRLPVETTAMSPGERYGSGFGPVEFSRSGPGYWKGSYGDPEGNLIMQNAGHFLFGTWEQGKQAGYAILEFNPRGFEGFWWYSGQVSFGGEWNGELQR